MGSEMCIRDSFSRIIFLHCGLRLPIADKSVTCSQTLLTGALTSMLAEISGAAMVRVLPFFGGICVVESVLDAICAGTFGTRTSGDSTLRATS